MAQAYVTTSRDTYKWPKIDKRKILRPYDKVAESLPEGDMWRLPQKISAYDPDALAEAKLIVKKMLRRRLFSTYQVSYCSDMLPKEPEIFDGDKDESALMLTSRLLYQTKTQKIAPPLPAARRVAGYLRPTSMYTPLSNYQGNYGKIGYDVLVFHQTRTKAAKPGDPCYHPRRDLPFVDDAKAAVTEEDLKKKKAAGKCKCKYNPKLEKQAFILDCSRPLKATFESW